MTKGATMRKAEIVSEIINAWDPAGLLAGGAPSNEYDIEIDRISNMFHPELVETELAKIIHTVFNDSLAMKLSLLQCLKCAFRMLEELRSTD